MSDNDYVSRKAAIEAGIDAALEVLDDADDPWKMVREIPIRSIVTEAIANIPPADVKPVVQGKWEKIEIHYCGRYTIVSMRCSECGKYYKEVYFYGIPIENVHFCSYCGADMRKETNDENS